jgi:hypothetical protein
MSSFKPKLLKFQSRDPEIEGIQFRKPGIAIMVRDCGHCAGIFGTANFQAMGEITFVVKYKLTLDSL